MANNFTPKKYNCEFCDFNCCKNSDYIRHINTLKHKRLTLANNFTPHELTPNFICTNCGNKYKHKSSLCKHIKKCVNNNTNNISPINNNIIMSLITQNQEFKELIIEQNKHIIELSKDKGMNNCLNNTNNIHNTTNNNHFNLQLFLNEYCKNALNIVEFVEQLNVTIDDLETTGRVGYAEGISRIFINGLKQLEVNQRPIHCSDAKRETLYIKDENKWEKDDTNKSNLEKAIRKVGQKNIRMIPEWKKKYPDCEDYYSKKNDLYLKIVGNSMCGGSVEETEHNYNKIKKKI
jgi:hypothetical protein